MRRESIDFETFKKHFIDDPDTWFPVKSSIQEDDNGEYHPVVNMDMIVEWRLDDGKIKFIEVPYSSEEEYQEIKNYLKIAADLLHKAILKKIDGLEDYRKEIKK